MAILNIGQGLQFSLVPFCETNIQHFDTPAGLYSFEKDHSHQSSNYTQLEWTVTCGNRAQTVKKQYWKLAFNSYLQQRPCWARKSWLCYHNSTALISCMRVTLWTLVHFTTTLMESLCTFAPHHPLGASLESPLYCTWFSLFTVQWNNRKSTWFYPSLASVKRSYKVVKDECLVCRCQ